MTEPSQSYFLEDYPAGTTMFRQGEPGDWVYVIQSGQVEIRREFQGQDCLLAVLGGGDFFGEMAVLAGEPREATVKAVEPLEALRIPADEFQAFLAGNPQIAVGMLKSLVERLREVQDRLDTWVGGVW